MTISKGEIWLVNLDPTIGDEIQKKRPAIVVNCDALGLLALRVVVPITGWQARFHDCDWLIRLTPDKLNCLDKVWTSRPLTPFKYVRFRRGVLCDGWAN